MTAGKKPEQEKKGRTETQSPRRLAIQCLVKWDSRRQPVQPFIDDIVYGADLPHRDRQLAVMLVLGVLRRLQELDAVIARFSRFPPARMKSMTLMALRVGVFQLLFLDRVPASAAVNETVQVLKEEKQPRWLVSFVNGVLRSAARSLEKESDGAEKTAGNGEIANHPDWLVQRWQQRFGPERTRLICRLNNLEPDTVLRVNTLRTGSASLADRLTEQGYVVRPGKYALDCLVLDGFSGSINALPGFHEGLFHVQDEAAQLVCLLSGPFAAGARFLDACAGVGGKTCLLAQLASPDAVLFAIEPNSRRYGLLEENLQRLGLASRVRTFQGHLHEFDPGSTGFDAVLVDAPCSGTGVIGRHPDIRWNRRPEDLPGYQRQQLELLEQACLPLNAGGVLVYATCSMEPEENRQVIEQFVNRHQEFILTDCRDHLPEAAGTLVDEAGFFSSTPAEGLDGFFAARLLRQNR